jgi:hypothetical protein
LIPWDKNTSFQSPDWPLFNNVDTNLLTRRLLSEPTLRTAYVQAAMAVHTGFVVFDKYLGDALYAAMVYTLLRLFWRAAASARLAVSAMALMTVIELFQLTMIPAHLLANEHVMVRICARLMGTEFSFLDLLAYGVGIGCIYLADSSRAA